jgi:hypothetical protein
MQSHACGRGQQGRIERAQQHCRSHQMSVSFGHVTEHRAEQFREASEVLRCQWPSSLNGQPLSLASNPQVKRPTVRCSQYSADSVNRDWG